MRLALHSRRMPMRIHLGKISCFGVGKYPKSTAMRCGPGVCTVSSSTGLSQVFDYHEIANKGRCSFQSLQKNCAIVI